MKIGFLDDKDELTAIAKRPLSRLTYRIMGINLITLAALAMSFSYLDTMRRNLISNEMRNFAHQTRLYAALVDENMLQSPNLKEKLISVRESPFEQINIIYNHNKIVASSGDIPTRMTLRDMNEKNLDLLSKANILLNNILSVNFNLPSYSSPTAILNGDKPKIQQVDDDINLTAWGASDGGLILSSAINLPSAQNTANFYTLQVIRRPTQIEEVFSQTRLDIMRYTVISLILTICFSLYLSAVIGHPLRNLATAAEAFRLKKGRGVDIPDMSARRDEIGELSHSMREMALSLKQRMASIEEFAADVAHELKNPLTSMKSALETLPKAKKEGDKERLVSVLHHDVERMDRLITDISQASRLDAEMARDVFEKLDLRDILRPLVASKTGVLRQMNKTGVSILLQGDDMPIMVNGHGGRLARVFDNLITNAITFSPENGRIIVQLSTDDYRSKIIVDDEGRGIPDSHLAKIFDRFYTERPASESFGLHSGLGLSIAKQIVESHGGTIQAENRKNETGKVMGARFIVRFRHDAKV